MLREHASIVWFWFWWDFTPCLLQEIGDLYEPEHNIEKAIVYFERAAELFEHAEATTSANQCKQKVAEFSAQLEQWVAYANVMDICNKSDGFSS